MLPNMSPRANQQTDMFTADAGAGTRKHTLLYGDWQVAVSLGKKKEKWVYPG